MRYKSAIFLFLSTISYYGYSQVVPEVTKKVYTSPDGNMYVQKDLPIYLRLSTSPDGKANNALLKSSTPQYANPFYFDMEGYNSIKSPWCVDTATKKPVFPQKDIVFVVYADSKCPITKIDFGDAKPFNSKGKTYVSKKAEIKLSAKDELSGVDKIMYSVDGENYKEYNTPVIFDAEKEYILKYYSYDNVGNLEQVRSLTLVLDKSNPVTTMEIKGDSSEQVLSGKTLILFSATDNSSGVDKLLIQLDDGLEQNYPGPINTVFLTQGEHKISYRSIDKVNNEEQQHTYNFYVDKTPPTIIQEVVGKSFMVNGKEFSSGRTQLKLTTIDNKAGVKEVYYSINNKEYKKYDSPVTLSSTGGVLNVKSYAIDKVNNRSEARDEEANNTKIPYIDLSGPVLNFGFRGPVFVSSDTTFINKETKIALKAFDNEAGLSNIQYKIDGGELKTYDAEFSIELEGLHTIEYIGIDNVDNTTSSSFTVLVDNTGPEIYPRFSTLQQGNVQIQSKNLAAYPRHVGLFVAATDVKSGYEKMFYSVNGSGAKPFSGYINGFSGDNASVLIKAYDKLGNESVATIEFGIVK